MPDELRELDAAVRELYDAFAARHRRQQLDCCGHCVSPEQAHALNNAPLGDLSADLIRVFVLNAVSETWGSPDDLWYYLPRVLDLVARGELSRYDIGGLFVAVSIVWREWPQDQTDALTGYLGALRKAIISGYWPPGKPGVHGVLELRDVRAAASDLGLSMESLA